MRPFYAVWLLSATLVAQELHTRAPERVFGDDDARLLLARVRNRVMDTVERLPRYMCTETVDRVAFQPEEELQARSCDDSAGLRKRKKFKLRERSSDRLRLDVAVSRDSEMYSWVGEQKFEDSSLADLVRATQTLGSSLSKT